MTTALQKITKASSDIKSYIRTTPLEYSPLLSRLSGAEVFLKLENYQLGGSFKIRGAINKLLSLSEAEKKQGVITASSGNHGHAVAIGLTLLKIKGTIFLPESVSKVKLQLIDSQDVDVVLYGKDTLDAELKARETSNQTGQTYISPYNDFEVICGQGTIGLELQEQNSSLEAVFVPVGGGGLISGIALSYEGSGVEVIGCQPAESAVMYHSIKAGKILDLESRYTISDGTAGGIEPDAMTFKICQDLVHRFILLEEQALHDAMRLIIENHFMWIEGAAALSVAALLKDSSKFRNKKIGLIICGNKLKVSDYAKLIEREN